MDECRRGDAVRRVRYRIGNGPRLIGEIDGERGVAGGTRMLGGGLVHIHCELVEAS